MNSGYWLYPYSTTSTTANTFSTIAIAGPQTIYGPLTRPHVDRLPENAVIPDTAEQWLRRRVKEVCELAAA